MRVLEGWLPPLVVAALALAVYANSLDNSFHFDDQHSLLENPHLRALSNIPSFFVDPQTFSRNPGSEMYRPLVLVSYAANLAANRFLGLPVLHGIGFHLVNMLAHAGVAVCLFYLLRHLGMAVGAALAAGLLFGGHPLAAEPVNYISSRSESMAALGMLAALLFYLRRPYGLSPPSVLCFAAGLLCKSVSVVVPLMLLAHEWLGGERRLVVLLRRQWGHWLVLAAYLVVSGRLLGEALVEARVRGWGAQLATQAKALVYYLKLLAVPHPLTVEHGFIASGGWTSFLSAAPLLGAALALSLLWLALSGRRDGRAGGGSTRGWDASLAQARRWLVWLLIGLLPTAIVPLNVLVSERRLYLAAAAATVVVVALLWTQPPRLPRWLIGHRRSLQPAVVAFLFLLGLAPAAVQRNRVWASELELWEDARRRAPQMVRPHLRVGVLLREDGHLTAAESAYRQALALDPTNASAHNNLGNIYRLRGDTDAAEHAYVTALRRLPRYADALINLGALYSETGRLHEAVAVYDRARPLAGGRLEFFNNLGTTYLRLQQFARAESSLREGLALRGGDMGPDVAPLYRNLAGALEGQGQVEEALRALDAAVTAVPAYAAAYYDRGRLLAVIGDSGAAVEAYQQFLRHWRGDAGMAAAAERQIAALQAVLTGTGQ